MDEHGVAGDAKEAGGKGLSEALRQAVEKTFAATAEPRDRAQSLIGDLGRRGLGRGETLGRRGQEAREASAAVASRLAEMVEGLRQVRDLEARVVTLEKEVEGLKKAENSGNSKPGVEG